MVGLSVILMLLAACNRGQDQAGAGGQAPPTLVTAVPAIAKDVPIYLDEPVGKATATEFVTIQPQITGMLVAKHFDDGADVHKGDLLFEIDPRPFRAALDQAEATLLSDKAALVYAQQEYTRVQSLTGASAMSQDEIDQKKSAVDAADAQVKAGQAAVEIGKLNLEYCKIRSPMDGRAGQRLVDPGNVVNSAGPNGGTNLLVIQKINPIYADFTVTENDLARVREFMADGTLKVEAELPEDMTRMSGPTTAPAVHFEPRVGELIFLDNSVQDGSGTVKLRALVPNEDHHFWPGQFVNVRLILKVQKDAVLIPNQATQISQTGPFVYTVDAQSVAHITPIGLGQRYGDMVMVDSGLKADDKVVVSGQGLIFGDKTPVMVIPSGPPAGAGGH